MTIFQDVAKLHEKTVKETARKASEKRSVAISRPRRKSGRPRATKVVKTCWSDTVDPRIVEYIKEKDIDWKLLKIVSSTDVVIMNNPIK